MKESHEPSDADEVQTRLGDVLSFMRLLWAVDHGLQSTSKRMETSLGVTGPQRLVIRIVGRYPGISAGQLAEILHIHPSTLTGILKRLEKRGLVERRIDPEDARRALFGLTVRGRELDATRAGTVEAAVRRGLARLTRKQVETAQEALAVLAEVLGEEEEEERSTVKSVRPKRGHRRAT